MTNIGSSVIPDQLKVAIADYLHRPEYSAFPNVGWPMNLEVVIFRRRGNSRVRAGALTLPSSAVGQQFLRDFGGLTPRYTIALGTRVKFQPSDKPPRPDVLQKVNWKRR